MALFGSFFRKPIDFGLGILSSIAGAFKSLFYRVSSASGGSTVDIDTRGIEERQAVFRRIDDYVSADLEPDFQKLIEDLRNMYGQTFASGGPRSGRKWKKVAKSVARQQQDGVGHYSSAGEGRTLVWSGRLRDSLTSRTSESVAEIKKGTRGSYTLRFGTTVPYAMAHHKGATIHRPAISPVHSRVLTLYHKDGSVTYAAHAAACTIVIPKREFHTRKELQEVFGKFRVNVRNNVFEIWTRGRRTV